LKPDKFHASTFAPAIIVQETLVSPHKSVHPISNKPCQQNLPAGYIREKTEATIRDQVIVHFALDTIDGDQSYLLGIQP